VKDLLDSEMSLPDGTEITGTVTKTGHPVDRSGFCDVVFNQLTLPNGQKYFMVAGGVTRGGVIKVRRGEQDVLIDSGNYFPPDLQVGQPPGLTPEHLQAKKLLAMTMRFIAKKGRIVCLLTGDQFKLELCEDLRLPDKYIIHTSLRPRNTD
jgi:hypothetical protein